MSSITFESLLSQGIESVKMPRYGAVIDLKNETISFDGTCYLPKMMNAVRRQLESRTINQSMIG